MKPKRKLMELKNVPRNCVLLLESGPECAGCQESTGDKWMGIFLRNEEHGRLGGGAEWFVGSLS